MSKKIRHPSERLDNCECSILSTVLSNDGMRDGWSVLPVRQIAQIVRGVTYSKSDAKETNNDGYMPILRATNIQDNGLVLDRDLVYVPNKYISEEQKIKIGDIVIATSSGSKHLVGKTAQVKAGWRGSFGAFCAVVRPSDKVEPRYLGYFFNSPIYKSYISAKAMGVNINNLRRGDIEELQVPLASIDEQKSIVAEIEKQFSRLDEAVANLKRVKANLKRYKAAVLKAAVEGKLTEDWRETHPDVEPANVLLEDILVARKKRWDEAELSKMKAKGKKLTDDKWKTNYEEPTVPFSDKLPSLPIGWVFAGLEQLLQPQREAMKTGPFGSLLKKHEHKTEGVPVLGIENILAMQFIPGSKIHITKQKAKDLDGYTVLPGDILISRSGTVGEVCVVPENIGEARISTNLLKLSLAEKGMLPDFFTFLFNGSPFVLNQVSELCKGSTRIFLNQDILKRLVFVLPPFQEQIMIVQEVIRRFSLIDGIAEEIEHNVMRAERLRQSVLKSAFCGNLAGES